MDVKTTFRNLVRDQSVSICMLQYIIHILYAAELDLQMVPETYVQYIPI